jgi:hypothetical protein
MLIDRLQLADKYQRQTGTGGRAGAGGRQRAQVRKIARAHFRAEPGLTVCA